MKEFNASRWARPAIRDLVPYSSARDEFSGEDYIFLDANESPFPSGLNRYPDPYQGELKKAIAGVKDCRVEQLFLGNGSDEAIDLLMRCFCEPGRERVLSIEPSYGMYRVCAGINGLAFDTVLLNRDFSLDADALLAAATKDTKLIFICSPNNPTGNIMQEEAVIQVLDNFPGIVVIDEAYQDFAPGPGFKSLLANHQNLVILQTFSKAWGLAGARLGMAIADPGIISYLNKVKYPYNINRLSQDSVIKAIQNKDDVISHIELIKEERDFMANALKAMPDVQEVFPSQANFLLVKIENPRRVYKGLIDKGVVVRDRSSMPLCEGCLRITIGTPEENRKMLDGLRALKKGAD